MKVKFENEVKEWKRRKRVGEILKELNLNREEVLVVRGKELLVESDWVGEEDEVEIWRIVSGG